MGGAGRGARIGTSDRRRGARGPSPGPSRHYLDGLATTLSGAAIPYGFTLVVWSSGALVIDTHGEPRIGDVALFAAGACLGYVGLRVFTRRASTERSTGIRDQGLVRASLIQAGAIAAAITVSGLCARLETSISWLLASFCATLVYLAGTAISETLTLRTRIFDLRDGD